MQQTKYQPLEDPPYGQLQSVDGVAGAMVGNKLKSVQLGESSIGIAAGLQVEAWILHRVALVLRLLHGNLVLILLRHVNLHLKITMHDFLMKIG